ncbi:hypothetical protein U8335_07815 [Roseiconus lacunae]|uniref:hypothetical protein n=1 Tax=Roseiconus lacunae TaxID=2605694 RepID=UPI0030919E6E|nr:hypothetical protein U8335_07815 [Stieleria sp. HD01]
MQGKRAVHSHRSIPDTDSRQAVKKLFHFCYLFVRLSEPESWNQLNEDDFQELASEVAGLPTQLEPESEEAKHFRDKA